MESTNDRDAMKLSEVLERMKVRIEGGSDAALVDTVAMPTCRICKAVGKFNQYGQIELVHDRDAHYTAVKKQLADLKAPTKVAAAVAGGSWYDSDK